MIRSRRRTNGQKKHSATNVTLFEWPPERTDEFNRNVIIYTRHDHRQLQPPNFLNDTNISFFMQYHLDNRVDKALKDRIHIFNSFFFAKIKSIRQRENGSIPSYEHASRWLKGVNIFDKDFLIMPVCEDDHWLLVIVCYPSKLPQNDNCGIDDDDLQQPAVFVLNSCTSIAPPPIKKALSQFLKYQWMQERKEDRPFSINNAKRCGIRLVFPDLPQQKNNYDCGVYILGFFISFLNDPRSAYLRMYRRKNMRSWFQENSIDISRERRKMISVIKSRIEAWAISHKMSNGSTTHEILIDSPSPSIAASEQIDKSMDEQGNEHSVIVIH